MPYLDRQNRTCGFLDIEENENSDKFYRRYFILDTHENFLLWYMDNPQNLPPGTVSVGSLRLSYISKVNEASVKQKPKAEFCFVINALSRRYFLQANDAMDLKEWVIALNNATKITVPKASPVAQSSDATNVSNPSQSTSRQAYKTEIVGGVVVHTPVQQSENEDVFTSELGSHISLRRSQSVHPNIVRSGYCVKQGNVRKSWKRRFFILDDQTVSYYKSEMDKEPLRSIRLRDVLKVNECLVKSGDLLSRDNLFEIITSTRTFYIQTDTPEDMKGWIKDIASKIQDFRGPSKLRCSGKVFSVQRKPQLVKSCSTADSWQPWTPVPNQEKHLKEEGQREGSYSSLPSLLHFQSTTQQTRQRHHSQPQLPPSVTDFPDSLDHLRSTDV
ncbi:pleckstrin homology domain-containing family A member 2-like [Carassius auratus]|uniref:Pleckstrin homology domain-containing family A member 2-like n=1 Tax=Carassius auratus TaxID=7957 RepID=A0A6P6MVY3_CARAU|nr:pleckstrin homology domain-containing family A member 2-like [Carassius auratus]XP_026100825.1 pleckstrin homology domain-containing family A member 2-like [Carassius auratus]XP_052460756.1 pleckstrin homology domain-containing family A member 2 isoform X1 [Carassius gibelio]XP_052460757.1 pleckstrin homology domain-containing family A member 2 isoform X1 [Carassius gibelio]